MEQTEPEEVAATLYKQEHNFKVRNDTPPSATPVLHCVLYCTVLYCTIGEELHHAHLLQPLRLPPVRTLRSGLQVLRLELALQFT